MTMSAQAALRAAAQHSESVNDITTIAATAEALAVTLLGAAIAGAAGYDGGKGLNPSLVTVLKAAQATEQAHYNFLTGAGAKPLTLTFTIPANLAAITKDSKALFSTIEQLETAFISAYAAAAREFAEMKQPDLVRVALQIAGTEAEHRALARLAQGDPLPHNVAFEAAQFSTVHDAATALQNLGLIGGSGTTVNFADFTGRVDSTGLANLTPNGVAASPLLSSGTSGAGASPAMPANLPKTGGIPIAPIVAVGAGFAALGGWIRQRTST